MGWTGSAATRPTHPVAAQPELAAFQESRELSLSSLRGSESPKDYF